MSLINQIKADQVEARKARNAPLASLLTTLLGEAQIIGKNAGRETTNDEVVEKVKAFIKNINFSLEKGVSGEAKDQLVFEKAVLERYLPEQLSEERMFEIIKGVRELKGSKIEMKEIMNLFKNRFPGQYDGKVLSGVAKNYLEAQV